MSTTKQQLLILAGVMLAGVIAVGLLDDGSGPDPVAAADPTLAAAMAYLEEIPDVAWHEVSRNTVHVAFSRVPGDLQAVIRGAALRGNRLLGRGVHVWVVSPAARAVRFDERSPTTAVTARSGAIEALH